MNTRPILNFTFSLFFLALALLPVAAQSETHTIDVGDNFFSDDSITIQVGDTVRWVNPPGGNNHNVTGSFGFSGTSTEFTYEVTFNTAGTFPYECTIHDGMDGTITVEGGGGGGDEAAELDLQLVNAVNGSYSPGDLLTINSTIINTGDADSGSFDIDYYASSGTIINTLDTLLGSAEIPNIEMGDTLNHQAIVSVPESLEPGDYFIGAILSFNDASSLNNVNHDPSPITILPLFFINPGLNDAWVGADAPFQGFFFTVFQDISLFFLSWFTFEAENPNGDNTAVFGASDQRWVTGAGVYEGNSVTLSVELTSGGIFNGSDPLATQTPGYGTITIIFLSCNEALLTYDFPGVGLFGQMTLTRVVDDNVPLCDLLNAPP